MNDEPNEQCLLIINKDLDGIIREANIVDPKKFGFSLPEDVPFEDLSNMRSGILCSDSSSSGGSNGAMPSTISQTSGGILKSESKVGMLAAMKLKKLYGVVRVFNAGKVNLLLPNSLGRLGSLQLAVLPDSSEQRKPLCCGCPPRFF
ncbi:hypothetical protein OUZ56_021813 [Daphnia magna]|uniref:Uncharacterized protein n=1 Tax=Daphnia magna TaxID=35525 RepID=A0ABR0AUR2_9CRUS|nr:hypothetical protein OUZ56_021813 [Daphnia magna]